MNAIIWQRCLEPNTMDKETLKAFGSRLETLVILKEQEI